MIFYMFIHNKKRIATVITTLPSGGEYRTRTGDLLTASQKIYLFFIFFSF